MNNYEKIINEYQKMYESLKSDLINQSSEKKGLYLKFYKTNHYFILRM